MPSKTKPSNSAWEDHKETIRNLYLGQDLKLKNVQAQLADLGFAASKWQYETKLKEWGFSKNIPVNTWKHVGHKIEKRKREGKDSVVSINGVEITAKRVKKETSRHFYSVAQRLEIERNNAPSPPDLSVATPTSTQEVSFPGGWPKHLPWFTFTRLLDAHLSRIYRNPQTFHGEMSWTRKKTQESHVLSESDLGTSNLDGWQIVFDNIKQHSHLNLAHTVLPLTSDIGYPAEVQQDMSLESTSTNHWGLKVLIYLASNKLLDTSSIDRVWRMINEAGIRELANFSKSLQLKDASLAAALEYLFQTSMEMRHKDLVSWLLDTGMDPNTQIKPPIGRGVHLPLIVAMNAPYSPNTEIIRLLLENGASPMLSCCEDHRSPVQSALWNNPCHEDVEILDLFLKAAETLNNDPKLQSPPYIHRQDATDVNSSAPGQVGDDIFDKTDHLVDLIEEIAAKTAHPSATLITPESLIHAVESNNQRLVRIIHKHGLPMDCYDNSGRFPLQAAVQLPDLDIRRNGINSSMVSLLLELGASPNYGPGNHIDGHCSLAVEAAVNSSGYHDGQIDAIRSLCQHGALVQGRPHCGKYGHDTLMDCVLGHEEWMSCHLTEVMLILYDAGLPLSESSLLDALELTHYGQEDELDDQLMDFIQAIPEDSLNLFLLSERGWTALDYAVSKNLKQMVHFLVEEGVKHTRRFAFGYCLDGNYSTEVIENVMARVQTSRNDRQLRALLIHRLIGTLRATDQRDRGSERVFELLHDYSLMPRSSKHDAYVLFKVCSLGDTELIWRALRMLPDTYSPAALGLLISPDDCEQWELIKELLRRRIGSFVDLSKETRVFSCSVKRAMRMDGGGRILDWFSQHDSTALEYANLYPSSFTIKAFGNSPRRNYPLDITQWFNFGLKASSYLGLLVTYDGQVDKMSTLLHRGFQPNRRICWTLTALQFAVVRGDRSMTLRLLEAGCDVNARPPWRDIPEHVSRNIPFEIQKVLTFYDRYTHRRNALQLAAERGDLPMVTLLLEFGADVNGPPSRVEGATALQVACMKGYIGIVKFLLSKGADINASGAEYFGRTALEGAAEHGRLDVACLLLEHDCRVDGSFRRQYIRAVAFSSAQGHHILSKMLQDYGKWNEADEDLLKQTDLRDKKPKSRDLEEILHHDEEVSDVDPDEFKPESDHAYPFDSDDESNSEDYESDSEDYESDPGDYGSAIEDSEVAPSAYDACQKATGGPGWSEQPIDPSWDELLEYYGGDEQETF